jgi:hypothetical protein
MPPIGSIACHTALNRATFPTKHLSALYLNVQLLTRIAT